MCGVFVTALGIYGVSSRYLLEILMEGKCIVACIVLYQTVAVQSDWH